MGKSHTTRQSPPVASGGTQPAGFGDTMPRFVILEHDHPFLHWDLMLEAGDALRTWRLLEDLRDFQNPGDLVIAAETLPDHRLAYLDYEGPVSGNRGFVKRWDAGEYELIAEDDSRIRIALSGERIRGEFELRCDDNGDWRFTAACGLASD